MPYIYTWDGPKDGEDAVDQSLNRNITEVYTLITDDPTMGQFGASAQFSADKSIGINDPHWECTYAYCSSIRSKFHQGSTVPKRKFDITVTYTTSPDSGGAGTTSVSGPAAPAIASQQQGIAPSSRVDAPLSRGWDLFTTGGTRKAALFADALGNPYKNTVGDPLLPPLQRDVPTVKYRLSINRAYRAYAHLRYQGCTNDRTVILPGTGESWASETLKFLTLEITPVYENNTAYYRHDYNFESGPYWTYDFATYLGWVLQVPNVGKRTIQNIGGVDERIPIYDKSNCLVSEPQYLASDSTVLDTGFATGDIYWLNFHPDPTANLALIWS